MQQFAHQILAADDIEEGRDRHHHDTDHHPPEIDVGGAKEGDQQGKGDVHRQPHQQHRQGDGQTGPHALGDVVTDITTTVGGAEIELEQLQGFLKEDGLGQFCPTLAPRHCKAMADRSHAPLSTVESPPG